MRCFPDDPIFPGVDVSPKKRLIGRLLTTTLAISCAGWSGMTMFLASSNVVFVHASDQLILPAEMAWTGRGLEGQIVVENAPLKINVEAYNRKREKDIADDSKKLLS